MKKFDIVNGLAREYGFSRYLEICTTTTGRRFDGVDGDVLPTRHRLVYRCPETYDDGAAITFRTANDHAYELIRTIDTTLSDASRYDIILVDSFHSYENSLIDLHGATCLLRPGGILVVHDCNPRDPSTVGRDFHDGNWCGLTYQAFLDFVWSVRPSGYCTVDTDFGCGIVYIDQPNTPAQCALYRPTPREILGWSIARHAAGNAFAYFAQHRDTLLNLMSTAAFGAMHPEVARAVAERALRVEPPALPTPAVTGDIVTHDIVNGTGHVNGAGPVNGTANGHSTGPVNGHATQRTVTADPDLHLWMNGHRINPIRVDESSWTFDVSGQSQPPYLMSRATRPSDLGASDDSRVLGIRVHEITAEAGDRRITVRADRGAFQDGFYDCEFDIDGAHWRWTNGRGQLPPALWDELGHPTTVTISGRPMERYLLSDAHEPQAAHP